MTMKLPIILSTMIAALAMPGTFASQAETESKDAPATDVATEDKGHKPEAHHADGKHKHAHHHKHGHKHHGHNQGQKHQPNEFDQSYDDINKEDNYYGKNLPPVEPGKKAPEVPAGQ